MEQNQQALCSVLNMPKKQNLFSYAAAKLHYFNENLPLLN
jgi:hypothetical protein